MLPVLLLLGVTAIWGWTFVVVRDAVQQFPVMPFLALRFALAAALLLPAGRGGFAWRSGLLPGCALAAGYVFQTVGLQYTTASQAGLLTGLFVVFTPLLVLTVYRLRPGAITLAAVFCALLGTLLLTSLSGGRGTGADPLLGDAFEVLTALAFSAHMLLLGRAASQAPAADLALTQMLVVGAVSIVGSILGGVPPAPSVRVWIAILITGALASALAFWVQTYVQGRISPTRTAVILVAEPAFAAFFGVALAGDRFTPPQALGAAFILLALIVHEAYPALRSSRSAAT